MPPAIPLATYRLQLTAEFNFDAAAAIVPYLEALGISHVYASPFTTALKGTVWDGLAFDVGRYIHVQNSGNDTLILISNAANGAASLIADLHSGGPVNLSSVLAHSVF